MRPFAGAAVAMLVCATPTRAVAQNVLLGQGIAAYDDLEYEEAIRRLSAALLVSDITPDERAETYRYLGLSYLLLDRPEPATGAFRNLLALHPETRFDEATAPRIVSFFESVRRQWEADGRPGVVALPTPAVRPVRIVHVPAARAPRGQPLDLDGRVEDPDGLVRAVFLHYRRGSRGPLRRVALVPGIRPLARIPGSSVGPPTLEYYLEAVGADGRSVATRGDAEAPLRVLVEAPASGGSSILGQWWFWTGAAIVVGGAVAIGLVLSSGDDPPDEPIPGPANVRIRLVEGDD